MADAPHSPPPTLIEEVRRVLRLQHDSIHTERSYVEWIRRFARFHQMRSRADLFPAESKIEAFLTDLALQGKVAASTQNQAMNALVLLYKRVLHQTLEDRIDAVRAEKKVNVPVVMTRDEVATRPRAHGGHAATGRQIALRQRLADSHPRGAAGGPGRAQSSG